MYTEQELIPISALQHYSFCPRQWGLIHLEQLWLDNRLTAEGHIMHKRTHSEEPENRPGIRTARSLRICSYRYGIVGQADVVEFHQLPDDSPANGIALQDQQGEWSVLPVEYKRGKPKKNNCDKVQLCAQTLCLEEMLDTSIEEGALYYGQPRKRFDVRFDSRLREETISTINQLHELIRSAQTPKQRYSKKCKNCSLIAHCIPKITGIKKNVEHYIMKTLEQEELPK